MTTTASRETSGLTRLEAARRLDQYGRNTVPPRPRTPLWRRLVMQLRDPLILVLIVAVLLTIATGDHADALIIAVVVIANTAVGIVQEIKADKAIAALSLLSPPTARVVRDGTVEVVDAARVVPGDMLVVNEGDVVAADGELVDAAALLVDEATLTGESLPVEKTPSDPACAVLHAGTVVVHGRGSAVVTRTGSESSIGVIAAALTRAPALTPLQRRLADLGRVLALAAASLCVLVLVLGLVRGQPTELMVVTAISLVVAAVPESLPAVITLSLALGARRMAARHAAVRRLPAVETLGAVTVIATDKTGTLTKGAVAVELIWTPTREVTVLGTGYEPVGSVVDESGELTVEDAPQIAHLLSAAVLCSDADIQPPDASQARWRPVGDPTEAALVTAAAKLGLDAGEVRRDNPRLLEAPFDSDRKRMTTVHRTSGGHVLVVCKGAPERVLTNAIVSSDATLLAVARARADAYAESGYRVLAVATALLDDLPDTAEAAEHALTLCGLVAMADPPIDSAASTVEACRAAGIIPVLITGDHIATARNVAERVGILSPGRRATVGVGTAVPDPREVAVFARTSPTDKLALVEAWQAQGHVVAMQGDGVNDAPSLRRADIGVAMGSRGTDVARQAADMVLTDDDLATVVAAVEEGRRVYDNVRRFLLYGLAGGAAEIAVMLVGPALGFALPLLPAQILWINLLTHGLPGVAIGAEPAEADVMRRPPRSPGQSIIGAGLWPRVLVLATTVTAASLGVAAWADAHGRPWQTMLFLALAMMQFGIALGVRAQPGTLANPFLPVAVVAAFILQLGAVYVAPLRELLQTERVRPGEIALVCVLSAIGYVAARLTRKTVGRRDPSSAERSEAGA